MPATIAAIGFKFQTAEATPPRSRGANPPELLQQLPLEMEGAGNAGCPLHPQPRVRV